MNDINEQELRNLKYSRIRRVKKFLRWMPRKSNLDRYPVIRYFSRLARHRSYLWCFKVPYVIPSIYAGTIVAFLPIYGFQIAISFFAALLFRSNVPIAVFLQIITNPLTAVPIYYTTYQVGKGVFAFLGVGPVGPINALIMGGFIVGLAVAAVLDVVYRILAWQTTKHVRLLADFRQKKKVL
ncbi:MAG: DUF2062 domain-containing protein [Opitutales bacterium]|nr:DUF2062 domain-containing protein [Opitutales bacterium]